MNIPMAAPVPPTHGPNKTAKIAGIKAAGQKATPPKLKPKLVKYPTTAYRAAQIEMETTLNAFVSDMLNFCSKYC